MLGEVAMLAVFKVELFVLKCLTKGGLFNGGAFLDTRLLQVALDKKNKRRNFM